MNCNNILESLAATSSRLEKEAILRKNRDDADLKQVFFLALNPMINFYIRKIPEYTPSREKGSLSLNQALSELNRFISRELTGNAAITHLQDILKSLKDGDALVIEKIIKRDLRCGVSEATANKIWKNLIPEYPVMLASGFDQKAVDKIKFPAVVQHKLDGMRFNAIVKDGKVEFRSRNGKPIDLLGELEQDFLQLFQLQPGKGIVYDGELLVKSAAGILDRKTGNGILNKAVKGTITKKEAMLVCATLWDIIPLDDFKKEKSSFTYKERFYLALKDAKFTPRVGLVTSHEVKSLDEAQEIFQTYLERGEEGIILKDLNAPWEAKRAKHQVKFKGELECDLKCVEWEKGTGKNANRLGNLVLESADGKIRVSVGTGFTDADRDSIKCKNVVGKIVAIKYNARIQDKNGGPESLFLPVFLEIREDKKVADLSKDIK
jgi:ATP-dependent DNA ligase